MAGIASAGATVYNNALPTAELPFLHFELCERGEGEELSCSYVGWMEWQGPNDDVCTPINAGGWRLRISGKCSASSLGSVDVNATSRSRTPRTMQNIGLYVQMGAINIQTHWIIMLLSATYLYAGCIQLGIWWKFCALVWVECRLSVVWKSWLRMFIFEWSNIAESGHSSPI